MAHLYMKVFGLLFVAWIVYDRVRNWLGWRALKNWGDQYGCGDAPAVPNKLPGGIERYKILFTGLKGVDFLDDIVRTQYRAMKCNTYRFFNVFNSVVLTVDSENIQAILATKFHDFDLGADRQNFHDVIGNGIFTSDGEAWQHYRQQLRPQFSRDQVSGDIESADRHLQVLFKSLPESNALGWIDGVDVKPFLYRFTMDVSTEFLFGESVNSQSRALYHHDSSNATDMQEDLDFASAMNFAQAYVAWRFRLGSLFWLARPKKFRKACQTIKDFAGRFVRIALEPDQKRMSAGTQGGKKKYVLLDELVEETRDPIELRDQILHILLAGRDTTSALISWTLLLLSRNPGEFQKLRNAVISQFGTETEPINEMTFSSLKSCKELTYFIYETLRLYPLVPMNSRRAIRNTTLPTGGGLDRKQPIAIMKGERVGYAVYLMHRRKDIWGEDAEDFIPARWEGRRLGWDFLPFSGGPRICLGQQYALNETAFVMAKFLQRYDKIEAVDMNAPINKGLPLILSPADGVNIKLHRAAG